MDYEYINEDELEEMFDEFLDEMHGTIEILGISYLPCKVLYECDPIAYRCEFSNWLDSESDRLEEINEERRIEEEGEEEEE